MNGYILRGLPQPATGSSYAFRGARRAERWPMECGARLGAAGCWNFVLRIGGRPLEVGPEALASLALDAPLFVTLDGPPLHETDRAVLRARIHGGGRVIASGDPDAWRVVVPELFAGRCALGVDVRSALAYRFGNRVSLLAPARWPVMSFETLPDEAQSVGETVVVSGERQTPLRALLTPQPSAPAVVRWRNLVFLNGAPFHGLQAWLQGQEDLQPWAAWRHRLFWLDEWVSDILGLLREAGALPLTAPPPIPGLAATSVVLRHDLDYSRDTSYLDAEVSAGLPAVHAVLKDANTSFWIRELARHGDQEVAFHYNTAHYSRAANWLRRRAGGSPRPYVPAKRAVAGTGLLKQVQWAKRNGVGIATLHRHLPFLQYPEWVDAFDEVYRQVPEVQGASSMFRGIVLRWGVDRADGGRGTYADHPDAQFPFWLPFKLAHAGDGGRLLRGWETASVMEVEPGLFEQMLNHRVPGLPQRVLTLNFHPAHAQGQTFAAAGSLANFRRVLEIIREARLPVLTLRSVFESVNRFVDSGSEHS